MPEKTKQKKECLDEYYRSSRQRYLPEARAKQSAKELREETVGGVKETTSKGLLILRRIFT